MKRMLNPRPNLRLDAFEYRISVATFNALEELGRAAMWQVAGHYFNPLSIGFFAMQQTIDFTRICRVSKGRVHSMREQ